MTLGTFHSACAQLLRRHGGALQAAITGLDGSFSIFGMGETKMLLTEIIQELDLSTYLVGWSGEGERGKRERGVVFIAAFSVCSQSPWKRKRAKWLTTLKKRGDSQKAKSPCDFSTRTGGPVQPRKNAGQKMMFSLLFLAFCFHPSRPLQEWNRSREGPGKYFCREKNH